MKTLAFITVILACAALGFGQAEQASPIPDALQAKRALLLFRREIAYERYILQFDTEIRAIEDGMRKACGSAIKGAEDGSVACDVKAGAQ